MTYDHQNWQAVRSREFDLLETDKVDISDAITLISRNFVTITNFGQNDHTEKHQLSLTRSYR